MKWLKIEIYGDEAAEEVLTALFLETGAPGVDIAGGVHTAPLDDEYPADEPFEEPPFHVSAYYAVDGTEGKTLERVKAALDSLDAEELGLPGGFRLNTLEVDEQDWANAWKAYFKPVRLTDNIIVKPTWEEYDAGQGELVIELDPGMAFGTGGHETTRMCVRLLEEFIEPGGTVVDVGTGSGILSAAAALLGAGRVYALDNDGMAVASAKENAARNGCGGRVDARKSDLLSALDDGVKADVMVANIIADTIVRLAPEAPKNLKRSAMLICSGIIGSRLEDVTRALEQNGFKAIRILNEGEWRAVACKYRG